MPLKTWRISSLVTDVVEGTTDIDNHADTCVVGSNALILHVHNRPVHVTGYDDTLESKVYETVSAALAYDDPKTGNTAILVVNQAISMPQLKHNLLCPMQLRHNDVEVDEKPKFLTSNPTEKSHAIVVKDAAGNELIIPLRLNGVTSYFSSRKPTKEEYEQAESHFDLTFMIHLSGILSLTCSRNRKMPYWMTMGTSGRTTQRGLHSPSVKLNPV